MFANFIWVEITINFIHFLALELSSAVHFYYFQSIDMAVNH